MAYREKILILSEEGKSYNEIIKILGCSKSTVCYHLGEGQREKIKQHSKKTYSKKSGLSKKLKSFAYKYGKVRHTLQRKNKKDSLLKVSDVMKSLGEHPKCYLTGDSINLEDISSYSLDHKLPISKGGESTLENLGLTTRDANKCKSDLTETEFIALCKKVLIHKGYKIT